MTIKGLTDNLQPRFPRLGKLRKGGEKVKDGYGPDLDHFRFTSDRPEIVAAFEEAYSKEPRLIGVYLPYATPDEAFPTWCEIWNASGLVHRCDGETMTRWLEKDKYVDGARPCAGGHEKDDPKNDAVGRLDVIVPELIQAGFVGYVTLETHGKNDLVAIMATLKAVYEARQANPLGLRGIRFNLRRVKESISVPGWGDRKGQRSRADKWLVKLEPAPEWVTLQLEMAHASQMGESQLSLPSGERVDLTTGEISEGELKPTPAAAPKPNGKPAPAGPVSAVELAAAVKTPNGTPLGTCTDEQLKVVIGNTGPKTTQELKAAAQLLLAKPDGEAWSAWYALATQGAELGLTDISQPADGISANGLRKMLAALAPKVAQAIENTIPENFR